MEKIRRTYPDIAPAGPTYNRAICPLSLRERVGVRELGWGRRIGWPG
jgi:hypothetical protein